MLLIGISEPEAVIDDVLDMIPDEDLPHLRQENFRNKFYLVKNEAEPKRYVDYVQDLMAWDAFVFYFFSFRCVTSDFRRRKKGARPADDDELEETYETRHHRFKETMEEENNCLPIKTVKGFQFPTIKKARLENMEAESDFKEASNTEEETVSTADPLKDPEEVTTAMLLARRQRKFAEYKVRIGVLSSSFLEDPEHRVSSAKTNSLVAQCFLSNK